MDSMLFGITLTELKRVAFGYAETKGIHQVFNYRKPEAGKDWCHDFLGCHKYAISLRIPEPTSAARAKAFNQGTINAFFDILETVQDENRCTPDRVHNVDKTVVTTVPNRPSKIIAYVGARNRWGHCRLVREDNL